MPIDEDAGRLTRLRAGVALVRTMMSLHPRQFTIAVAGASLFALCTVASSAVLRQVVDRVIVPRFEDGDVAGGTIIATLSLVVAVGVMRAAAVVVRRVWATMGVFLVSETLSTDVVDRLVVQPLPWHARRADGDLVARAGVDVDAAVAVLAPVPFAIGTVVLLAVSGIWLIVIDPVLGLVAVVVFPVLFAVNLSYERKVAHHYDEAQDHLGRFSAWVHESFEGVQLVKAFGAERRESERLATVAGSLRDARVKAIRIRALFETLLEVIPSLATVALVSVGAMRLQAGAVTVGELSSVVFLFSLLVFPLRIIGYALAELPHSAAGWQRVRDVVDEPIVADPVDAIAAPGADVALSLVDVEFGFTDTPVLHGATISVGRSRFVAVVGATGAGKTTLAELSVGLVAPRHGVVEVDPDDVLIVFQEAFLFSGTLRHNLSLGASFSDDELWHALSLAAADDFVRRLPDGLDTVVGERGVSLSGGQRQRVALARAIVRRPALLVLDDVTSALDPATESTVLANLRDALGGMTVLMVASRPSTIALADEVVFLTGGTIAAHGTHGELMRTQPEYRGLVEAFEADRERVEEPA